MNEKKYSVFKILFISLCVFLFVFGFIYFGFKPIIDYVSQGMAREIVLGLFGAGLVATVTGVLLAFERHLDSGNKISELRFETLLREYNNFNVTFFKIISDEELEISEIEELKGILFKIYTVGHANSYRKLEELIKKMEDFYKSHETDRGSQTIGLTEKRLWTKELERITKQFIRDDLNLKIDMKEQIEEEEVVSNDINSQEKKTSRNSKDFSKYRFNGEEGLNKIEYVKKLFKENFKNKKPLYSFEKFEEILQQQKDDPPKLWDDNNRHVFFRSKNPLWLYKEEAEEKKKNSTEKNWNRYFMGEDDIIKFKKNNEDDIEVVLRRGHSINDVEAIEKLFRHRKLKVGEKLKS